MNGIIVEDIRTEIARVYDLHALQAIPSTDGYVLTTNRGLKYVTLWPNQHKAHWAFLFREELAKRGYKSIDRFIRTTQGDPYTPFQNKWMAITDYFTGKPILNEEPYSLKQLGLFVAELYEVLQNEQVMNDSRQATSKDQIDSLPDRCDRFVYLLEQLVKGDHHLSSAITQQYTHFAQRLRKVQELSHFGRETTGFAPPLISLCWKKSEMGLTFFHIQDTLYQPGWQSLALLLQDIGRHVQFSNEHLNAFYNSFKHYYPMSEQDELQTLAYLCFPQNIFIFLSKLIQQEQNHMTHNQDFHADWLGLCQQQNELDKVHVWFAKKIDRSRQEFINV